MQLPGPVRLVVVRIDLSEVEVEAVTATGAPTGYATLREVASRERAVLAVNGDLAAANGPAHLLIGNGRLFTSGLAAGGALAFAPDGARAVALGDHPSFVARRTDTGARVRIARWNAGTAPGRGLMAFTDNRRMLGSPRGSCSARLHPTGAGNGLARFRVVWAGCGPSPAPADDVAFDTLLRAARLGPAGRWLSGLEPGTRISVRLQARLPAVGEAFGGFPTLVHAGRVLPQRCGPLTCALHPRTAVGVTRGCMDRALLTRCQMLMVAVDGRRLGWSVGITTMRLAHVMTELGASEAINLDGGASTQVLFRGRSLNRVAPGARRAVVSALIVRRRVPAPPIPTWLGKLP
jgi:hypothetical protein